MELHMTAEGSGYHRQQSMVLSGKLMFETQTDLDIHCPLVNCTTDSQSVVFFSFGSYGSWVPRVTYVI